jgi:hypothetical protein
MKQNSRSVTLETSETSSVGFDQLDHAIETLSRCVCDVKLGVVKKTF